MWSAEALKQYSKTELEAMLARFQVPVKKKQGKKSLAARIINQQEFVERCRQQDEECEA